MAAGRVPCTPLRIVPGFGLRRNRSKPVKGLEPVPFPAYNPMALHAIAPAPAGTGSHPSRTNEEQRDIMKRRFLVATLLSAFLPALVAAQSTSGPQPRMEMREMAFDFGDCYHQSTYEHTFEVRNLGNAALEIKAVNPSCGCTTVEFDRLISPGQTGKIALSIDGAKVHGSFDKSASVESNDPQHPHMVIKLTGREIPYVNVQPEGTIYLQGRYGEPIEQDLTITSNEKDLDFKVLGVTSNLDDKITYALENGTAPGEYHLKLYKNPKLSTLSTYGTLQVRSNSTRMPVTTLQVHVMTKGSIAMSPTVLNYGDVAFTVTEGKETPTTKEITLTRADGKFQIRDVTVTNPHYKAVVNAVTPGQQYRVQVTFTPPLRKDGKQTEAGELVIHTDDPQEPSMRVQLVARSL